MLIFAKARRGSPGIKHLQLPLNPDRLNRTIQALCRNCATVHLTRTSKQAQVQADAKTAGADATLTQEASRCSAVIVWRGDVSVWRHELCRRVRQVLLGSLLHNRARPSQKIMQPACICAPCACSCTLVSPHISSSTAHCISVGVHLRFWCIDATIRGSSKKPSTGLGAHNYEKGSPEPVIN